MGGGDFLFFKLVEHNLKHEVQNQIKKGFKDEELTLIELSNENKDNIRWIEFQKEFKYKGEMYDVVKMVQNGNSTYLYCFNDKKEEAFVSSFYRNLKIRLQKITNVYQVIFIVPVNTVTITFTSFENKFFYKDLNLQPISATVLAPPPEIS